MMDEATRMRLVGLFVSEAEESLQLLKELAGRFGGEDGPRAVGEFCGAAHSLKGAAGAVGLSDLVWVIHRLEALAARTGQLPDGARGPEQARLARALELLEAAIGGVALQGAPGDAVIPLRELLADVEPAAKGGRPPKPAPAAESAPAAADAGLERLSVPAHEVDEALRLASAVARVAGLLQEHAGGERLQRMGTELALVSGRLEALLFNLRMLPAVEALDGLYGEVQDLAAQLGKEVDLRVDHGDVRVDRRTLHQVRSLVRHLIRNALDHGLETPDVRLEKGKRRVGTLIVRMAMAATTLTVEVADDGAGFDLAAIRGRLEEREGGERVASLSDEEVLRRFAISGGSTRTDVTEVSGRGLGLSAVVGHVRARGGDFHIRAEPGHGSSVRLILPLEVYAADVLCVVAAGQSYGIPLSALEETVCLSGERGEKAQAGAGLLAVGERIVQMCPLAGVLVRGQVRTEANFAVLVRAEEQVVALTVDDLGESARVVPQAAPPWVQPGALVTGVALLADGTPLQVLNPGRLVALTRARASEAVPAGPRAATRRLSVLLAEDSLATREVLRVLLEREGYEVRVAGDGVEALSRVAEALPDAVVSDFNMPRCDGPSLTRALRAAARTARLPVVLLTSQDDAASRARGAEAGADAYLIKSEFNATVLRQTLRRLGVEA